MNTESWERLPWRGDDEQPSDLHTSPTTRTRAGRPEVSRSTSTASHLTNGQGQCAVRRPCPGGLVVVVLGVDRDGWGGTERKGKRPSGPPRPACVVWWRGAEPGAARARRHPSRPRDAAHVATGAWLSVHARAHLHRFQCGSAGGGNGWWWGGDAIQARQSAGGQATAEPGRCRHLARAPRWPRLERAAAV
jgi:hypothetical protein